jgi:hypothetical protein
LPLHACKINVLTVFLSQLMARQTRGFYLDIRSKVLLITHRTATRKEEDCRNTDALQ